MNLLYSTIRMSLNVNQNVISSASTAPLTTSEVVDLGNDNNGLSRKDSGKQHETSASNETDLEAAKDDIGTADDLQNGTKKEDQKDEVDNTSIFSLYMVHDFRYYFQHPYFRLFIAYFVTFCNFLIYAEDPVSHSEKECFIPVVGQCFSFVVTKYPPNGWAAVKVLLWLTAVVVGLIVGKLVIHQLLFNKLFKLKMFHEDHGSWMVMFFTTLFSLFVFSNVYNGFLLLGGEENQQYKISSLMGIKNQWFMKAAACGTWCGDFFTAWMVTDIMLQEKLYPHWAKGLRRWWNRGWHRIVLFWIVTSSTSIIVVTVISTDWISWDTLNRDFVPSNELMRAFLASFILVMDLLIVMQDWDFPHFINNFDIKLPGLNKAHIMFQLPIPKFLNKDAFMVHITGKWFNYGIILFVMLLDLNMWKNQIFYGPYEYGQYISPQNKVCSVKDRYSLEHFNETDLTYEFRYNTTNPATNQTYYMGDSIMNSRWEGFSLPSKGMAFIPSLLAFVCFGVSVWYFGRWKPTSTDPTAGRMKKRKKGRLSRMWQRLSRRRSQKIKRQHVDDETEEEGDLKPLPRRLEEVDSGSSSQQ